MTGRIVLISGPCGAGKTTVARCLAERGSGGAVHMHTDDFYHSIRRGYIPPWMDEADKQNETVVEAAAAAAKRFAEGGYEVYVDGVIGPWFLKPWIQLVRAGMDVRYIVLRPDEPTTVARAMAREQQAKIPLAKSTVTSMWRSLAHLGAYEPHAVDTSAMDSRQSAAYLRERLEAEGFRLLAATEPER